MTKPFSARELLLRISAILKRCSTLASEEAEVLRSGGLVLDLTARRVEVDGRQINLDAQGVRPAHRADEPPGRGLLPQAPAGHYLGRGSSPLTPAPWTPTSSISAVPSSRTATGSSPSAGWAIGSRRNKKEAGPSKGPASSSRDPSIHRAPPQKPSPCGGKVWRREPRRMRGPPPPVPVAEHARDRRGQAPPLRRDRKRPCPQLPPPSCTPAYNPAPPHDNI